MADPSGSTSSGASYIAPLYRCEKEHQLQNVRGIIPHGQVETPTHFGTGIGFHAMRDRWFTLKFATSEKAWLSIKDAYREAAEKQKLPVPRASEQQALVLASHYIEHWSKYPLPKVVVSEYELETKLSAKALRTTTGRVDDASHYPEAGGLLCVGEAKSSSASPEQVYQHYMLALQPLNYAALWKVSERGEAKHGKAAGVLLDVAQKAYKPGSKPKFQRFFIPVTDFSLQWYVKDAERMREREASINWDSDSPRNPTACARIIPGQDRFAAFCPYRDLCRYGRSAAGKYMFSDGSALTGWKPSRGKEVPPWE